MGGGGGQSELKVTKGLLFTTGRRIVPAAGVVRSACQDQRQSVECVWNVPFHRVIEAGYSTLLHGHIDSNDEVRTSS